MGRGRVFALYVMGYTAGRVWIELLRIDTANHVLGLRVNVWTSIIVFAGGLAYFLLHPGPRETVVEPGADPGHRHPGGRGRHAPAGEETAADADTEEAKAADEDASADEARTPADETAAATAGGAEPDAAKAEPDGSAVGAANAGEPEQPERDRDGRDGRDGRDAPRRARERAGDAEHAEHADPTSPPRRQARQRPPSTRSPRSDAETARGRRAAETAGRRGTADGRDRRARRRGRDGRPGRDGRERRRRRRGADAAQTSRTRRTPRTRRTRRTRSPEPRTACRRDGGSGSGRPLIPRLCARSRCSRIHSNLRRQRAERSAPADSRIPPLRTRAEPVEPDRFRPRAHGPRVIGITGSGSWGSVPMARIEVTVDGVRYHDEVEPRLLLVHYLRERLGQGRHPHRVRHLQLRRLHGATSTGPA